MEKDSSLFKHEFRDAAVCYSSVPKPQGAVGEIFTVFGRWNPPKVESEPITIHYGDFLVDVDFRELVDFHVEFHATTTFVVTNNINSPYGRVQMTNSSMTGFLEKPRLDHTLTGVAAFDSAALEKYVFPDTDFGYDVPPKVVQSSLDVMGFVVERPCFDIGSFKSYRDVNEVVEKGGLFPQ